ncbi:hypothetical protein BDF14DRAFT_1806270 [Spinellus fusiger]|nr:hypothetical protein BDF14DRAFT_1806270 [Spinellus fusiger]
MSLPQPFDTPRQGIEQPIILRSVATSCAVFLGWYLFWHWSGYIRTIRQRAYVLSLLSSFVTSISSLPLVWEIFKSNGDIQKLLMPEREWPIAVTSFFFTFLVLDLTVGYCFYRSKVELLTGWIHHIGYIITLVWTIQQKYCPIFITMCCLEIPTFLLALGSINKKLRHDYLFAGTFVTSRILFHAYMIRTLWVFQPYSRMCGVLSIFFPLHCYWFYGFIQQQQRLHRQARNPLTCPSSQPKTVPVIVQTPVLLPSITLNTKHSSKTDHSVRHETVNDLSVVDRPLQRQQELLCHEKNRPYCNEGAVYAQHKHKNHNPSIVSVH